MSGKYVVLTYHRVRPEADALIPDICNVERFTSQLNVLKRWFNVLPLSEAVARSARGDLPARTVCITFDDGYLDNAQIALPLLQKFGLPATFFIATGYLGDGMMWNDKVIESVRVRPVGQWDLSQIELGPREVGDWPSRRALLGEIIAHLKHQSPDQRGAWADALYSEAAIAKDRIMMTPDEVRSLHTAGMEIGGHTVSHPILTRQPDETALNEMRAGKQDLESLIDASVPLFAYPNGKAGADFDGRHARMVQEAGFDAAFSTMWGFANDRAPRFELPRVGLERESGWRFGAKVFKCFYEAQDDAQIQWREAA
ncbi:MAG: polysaccharide deacetylase family protein [Gammaproteobacteria bacterium]